jgi:hypothetical protein
MRPRFSLKWLLIAFTVLSVAFFVAIVWPTLIAQRFVSAIERGDYDDAVSMCAEEKRQGLAEWFFRDNATVKVTLAPRGWRDILKSQRSMFVQTIPERQSASPQPTIAYKVGLNFDAVATPFGIRPAPAYPLSYKVIPSGGSTIPSQAK